MPSDLYRDFAYCQLTNPVASGSPGDTLVVDVDDTSRLPSNTDLTNYNFWMTFESDLSTGDFEIVLVLSKTSTTVTVLRGQEGTLAPAHSADVYLKACVTAGILDRLTGELLMQDGVSSPPVPIETEDGTDWLYEG